MTARRSVRPLVRLWVRRLAPWIVSIAVITGLLYQYPLERIIAELKHGNLAPLLPWALFVVISTLLTIALWDRLLIRPTLGAVGYGALIRGKAASALLVAIHQGLGHGTYGVWLARVTGSGARPAIGVIAYIAMSEVTALALMASFVVHAFDADMPGNALETLRIVAPLLAMALIAVALLGPRLFGRFVSDPRLLKPWSAIPLRAYAISLAGRTLNMGLFMTGTWAAMNAFGIDIPMVAVATYLPVIILVASLPINVAGFGAVQAAWLLFTPWAPGEQVLAFQFSWRLSILAALILRSLPFLRRALREISSGAQPGDDGADDPGAEPDGRAGRPAAERS
ncbi:MAG: hypothetical protein AAGC55_13995 [Myxococcota bacterium]